MFAIGEAVYRESQRQFSPLACVAADQHGIGFVQHLHRTHHELADSIFDLGLDAERHGGDCQCRLRFSTHCEDVAQAMIGRDLTEKVWIIDKCTEVIDTMYHDFAGRNLYHSGVIGFMQADEDIIPRWQFKTGDGTA